MKVAFGLVLVGESDDGTRTQGKLVAVFQLKSSDRPSVQEGAMFAAQVFHHGGAFGIRSDSGVPGTTPVDTVIPLEQWNGNKNIINSLDWTKVQMIWQEFAWYGAGALRWGVVIDGEPWICHQVGIEIGRAHV